MNFLVTLQIAHLNSQQELDEFLHAHEYVFLKFYQETCGHCEHLAPRFIDLEDMEPKAKLAELNCHELHEVCNAHNIDGVPTLRLYKNGLLIGVYESLYRDPKPMYKWIEKTIQEGQEGKQL